VEAFFAQFQRAVSCVTPAVVSGRVFHPEQDPSVLRFGPDQDPTLLGRDRRLFLSIRHFYRIEAPGLRRGSPAVATVGYAYQVLDRAQQEIFSFHWHPVGHSFMATPHLHLHVQTPAVDLHKAHFPTGFVSLAAVLRFLIRDLGVEPLHNDWAAVLDEAERELVSSLP